MRHLTVRCKWIWVCILHLICEDTGPEPAQAGKNTKLRSERHIKKKAVPLARHRQHPTGVRVAWILEREVVVCRKRVVTGDRFFTPTATAPVRILRLLIITATRRAVVAVR